MKEKISKYIDSYRVKVNMLTDCQKLFPDIEVHISPKDGTLLMSSKQVNLLGGDVKFYTEEMKCISTFSSGGMTLHTANVFKSFDQEDNDSNIIIYGDPIIPLFCHSDKYDQLYIMNYQDIISDNFSNKKLLINKCNSYIINFISINKKINTTYLPSYLKKMLIFL